jgi:hypothetical protein
VNHDISDTFNRALEALMDVLWGLKICSIRAGFQSVVDKKQMKTSADGGS